MTAEQTTVTERRYSRPDFKNGNNKIYQVDSLASRWPQHGGTPRPDIRVSPPERLQLRLPGYEQSSQSGCSPPGDPRETGGAGPNSAGTSGSVDGRPERRRRQKTG